MIVIMTSKRLKALCQKSFENGEIKGFDCGVAKGYELGYRMRKLVLSNRGFIIGANLEKEIEAIIQKKWGR